MNPLTFAAFTGTFYIRLVPIQFNSAMLPSNAVSINVD